MSYDMTLGAAGYGFGGSSGLGGWLGNIGNAWQSGLSNNLRMATDLYNFTNKSLVDPSAVNAKIAQNNAIQEQQQLSKTQNYLENQALNALIATNSGMTLNDLLNRPNTQSVLNQQTQVGQQPVNQSPATTNTTAYAQQQNIGPYRTAYQFAPQSNALASNQTNFLQQMLMAPGAYRNTVAG